MIVIDSKEWEFLGIDARVTEGFLFKRKLTGDILSSRRAKLIVAERITTFVIFLNYKDDCPVSVSTSCSENLAKRSKTLTAIRSILSKANVPLQEIEYGRKTLELSLDDDTQPLNVGIKSSCMPGTVNGGIVASAFDILLRMAEKQLKEMCGGESNHVGYSKIKQRD